MNGQGPFARRSADHIHDQNRVMDIATPGPHAPVGSSMLLRLERINRQLRLKTDSWTELTSPVICSGKSKQRVVSDKRAGVAHELTDMREVVLINTVSPWLGELFPQSCPTSATKVVILLS